MFPGAQFVRHRRHLQVDAFDVPAGQAVLADQAEAGVDDGMHHDASRIGLEGRLGRLGNGAEIAQRPFDRGLVRDQFEHSVAAIEGTRAAGESRLRELGRDEAAFCRQRRHIGGRHAAVRAAVAAGPGRRKPESIAHLAL